MNLLPSTSSMWAPAARRMNSGSAPTDVNARTGLSTPPGRIRCAREKRREERAVFMADGASASADLDGREIPDRRGQETLFVPVVRAAARGVERARGRVEIALNQQD